MPNPDVPVKQLVRMAEARKRVIIESPWSGNESVNKAFGRACLRDSLGRGEAPLAGHLLYTQVLLDIKPTERRMGMLSGFAWYEEAETVVVYCDRGISEGMLQGIAVATYYGVPVLYRRLADGAESSNPLLPLPVPGPEQKSDEKRPGDA